jgi:hypothetical protein
MLILMVVMTLKGTSQTLDSVTCIPNTQLRKAINLIEEGKITKQELDSTKELVNYLYKRIDKKDSILIRYGQKDQYWKKIDSVNKGKIKNLNEIITNSNKIIDIQDKTIKKQKKLGIVKLLFGMIIGIFIVN